MPKTGPNILGGESLFDAEWYLLQHAGAVSSDVSPYEHYLKIGASRGDDPHPLFDTSYYLDQSPEVAEAGVNPLEHFLEYGANEGRNPHPLFETSWYNHKHPDVAATKVNPLLHYLTIGAAEGRDPHPLFDTTWYATRYPDVVSAGINPLVHYVTIGRTEGRSPHPHSGRRRIQVHRRNALGDVLLVTPVIAALRRKYPQDEIVVSTLFPEILFDNPHVDAVTRSRSPLPGFDETLMLEYEMWPEEHIVDAYARIALVSIADRTPEIYLTHEERAAANDLLRRVGIRQHERFCVMQTAATWRVRNWPAARFKKVAEALERGGIRIVVLGQGSDPPIDFAVDLRGQTTIRAAAAIIEKCALMVTVDSGLMHIAYAFRRPVVSLFGCTDPEKRVPDWALCSALYSDIVCRGCHHRQRPVPAVFAPECPWETVRCMERLSTEMVMAKVRAEVERAEIPLVSIVIPHYFKWQMLNPCLSSIFRYGARCSFEVIVVANGSPEDNLRKLQAWRPNVRIVTLQPNQGFSRACNAGARAARGKYVVFLNDDTTVTPGWLDEMVMFIEGDPLIGITGPKLLYPGNAGIQHCGTVFNEKGHGGHIYRQLPSDFAPANRPRFYRALTGACLLIERSFFLMLGEFEASYHGTGGCEDTDLCFKVLEQGKMVAYCPSSVVYHYEGVTRGLRDEHHPEEVYNRRILRERWSKYLSADISDYCLLAEIEASEGKTWNWLRDVPADLIAKYDSPERRTTGRPPYRIQVGSTAHPEAGYLRLDTTPHSPSVDIVYDMAEPLPFPDETAVEVLAEGVVESVSPSGLPKILSELRRILCKDGTLVIKTATSCAIAQDYLGVTSAADCWRDDSATPEGERLVSLCRAIGFSTARFTHRVHGSSRAEIAVVALR